MKFGEVEWGEITAKTLDELVRNMDKFGPRPDALKSVSDATASPF